mgnify:CR=1 FL=1
MKFTVNCNHLVHEGGSDDFIRFACAADTLGYDLPPGVFGQCKGLKTSKCHMPYEGFANDDIYYLEVCLFSQVPCQKPRPSKAQTTIPLLVSMLRCL